MAFFSKIIPGRTITDPDILEASNMDWLKSVRGEKEREGEGESERNK